MLKRTCRHCNAEYEYEGCANFITFCPHCGKCDDMKCEYGYGPVVPCAICFGDERIAMVTRDGSAGGGYRYDSEKFDVHMRLQQTQLQALEEARDVTAKLLSKA